MVRIVADNDEKVLVDPAFVIKGADGKDGLPGPEGLPGRDGIDGRDGKDGRDGVDGKDGKDGTCYWIEYDKKSNTLVFKNDAGKKNPAPIKLPSEAKGWGFAAGSGRGGGQLQADWNQTDKNNPTYIKNKPAIHSIRFLIVDELPVIGDQWTIYLVQESPTPGPRGGTGNDLYSEWVFVYNEADQSFSWEKLGTSVDLSGYEQKATVVELEATDSITLGDNTIYNGDEQTSLTISLPAASGVSFISELDFSSGNTPTTLSYSLTDIIWRGDDLQWNSTEQKYVFVPLSNKRYTVIFDYDGVNYFGTVRGS